MSDRDPFTQVYDAIWGLLADHPTFRTLVKTGNRITFSGTNPTPEKSKIMDADLPEVRLQPLGGEYGTARDTLGRMFNERYEIIVCTGDNLVHERLYPLRWAIIRALANWTTALQALTWNGDAFVRKLELQATNVGTSQIDTYRGVNGWAAVATIEVSMYFSHANLRG